MSSNRYRTPTDLEHAFLRVVTRGYPVLEEQIESCKISDYDPTGWCDVHITAGSPSAIMSMADGPALLTTNPDGFVEIILWTNEAGMLSAIEIVDYGTSHDDPYALFVDASLADPSRLEYRF